MQESLRLARYELAYQLHRPATLMLALLPLAQGFLMGSEYLLLGSTLLDIGYRHGQIYSLLASTGPVLIGLSTLFIGYGLIRDRELRTDVILYSLPVTPNFWLASRVTGLLAITLLLAIGYPLGIGLSLALNHPSSGATSAFVLATGFLFQTVTNILVLASLTTALTIWLRSIAGAYLTFCLGMIIWLVIIVRVEQMSSDDFLALLDPLGLAIIYDTVRLENTGLLATNLLRWPDTWYINRLAWVACSLALLSQADRRFADYWFGEIRSEKSTYGPTAANKPPLLTLKVLPKPLSSHNWRGSLSRATLFELSQLGQQPAVWAGCICVIGLTPFLATIANQSALVATLPTTATLTALRPLLSVFISALMLLLTGELVNRDQWIGLEPVFTVLPQPVWIRLTAKYVALSIVSLMMVGLVCLVMLLIQISSSLPYSAIDGGLYTQDIVLETALRQLQLIALFLLIAVTTRQRFLSHALSLVMLIGISYAHQLRFISPWLLYSSLPSPTSYSELIGYGSLNGWRVFISLQWSIIALVLVILSIKIWRGGTNMGKGQAFLDLVRSTITIRSLLIGLLVYGLVINLLIYQSPYLRFFEPSSTTPSIKLASQQTKLISQDGHTILIDAQYYHNYQVHTLINKAIVALQLGERLFGPYPYHRLVLEEIPKRLHPWVENRPGQIRLSEDQGWLACPDTTQLDYLDYVLTREIIKQWWQQRTYVANAGQPMFDYSLPEYLALQAVKTRYGSDRLAERLAQRATNVNRWRSIARTPEPVLTQTTNQTVIAQDQAALVFSRIGESWGDSCLQTCIGQYYRQSVGKPLSASAFVNTMNQQLPDSLAYLTDYLTHRFQFSYEISSLGQLPDELLVTIVAKKFDQNEHGQPVEVNANDWIPIVLTDDEGHQLYRKLVRPRSGSLPPPLRLPMIKGASQFIIDPLCVWMPTNLHRHRKRF